MFIFILASSFKSVSLAGRLFCCSSSSSTKSFASMLLILRRQLLNVRKVSRFPESLFFLKKTSRRRTLGLTCSGFPRACTVVFFWTPRCSASAFQPQPFSAVLCSSKTTQSCLYRVSSRNFKDVGSVVL